MQVADEELRERYQAASTNELLLIKSDSDLTDTAKRLLEEELLKRDVTPEDYEYARNAEAAITADRDKDKRDISRGFRRILIFLLFLVIMLIYFSFRH